MADADELFTVKNNFWLGNFEDAIAEAKSLRLRSEAQRVERDVLVYRSLLGMRAHKAVLDDIKEDASTPLALQAVKLYAHYLAGGQGRSSALSTLADWLAAPATAGNSTLQLLGATIYLAEGEHSKGFQALQHAEGQLEQLALLVQLSLRIDRPDLAEKHVKAMQELDDESVLTQLSMGWLCLSQAGDKFREASLLFRDIMDRCGSNLVCLNGMIAAFLGMRKFSDAERLLTEARSSFAGESDADTLINLIALAQLTGKPAEASSKWLPMLKEVAPQHPYLEGLARAEGAFDRVAASFSS